MHDSSSIVFRLIEAIHAQVSALVERLVDDEHYALAAYATKRWSLPSQMVFERWAHSLVMWAPSLLAAAA
jgi:hypothetical protein